MCFFFFLNMHVSICLALKHGKIETITCRFSLEKNETPERLINNILGKALWHVVKIKRYRKFNKQFSSLFHAENKIVYIACVITFIKTSPPLSLS